MDIRSIQADDTAGERYERPAVVDYGDLLDLTAGTSDGCYLDADFPVLTKKSQLGFSGTC